MGWSPVDLLILLIINKVHTNQKETSAEFG